MKYGKKAFRLTHMKFELKIHELSNGNFIIVTTDPDGNLFTRESVESYDEHWQAQEAIDEDSFTQS